VTESEQPADAEGVEQRRHSDEERGTRMVTVVDTTAVTWNMVIASDTDNDHPPNVTVPDVFDRLGTLAQWEDAVDDRRHLAMACRRLEGNLVRMVH